MCAGCGKLLRRRAALSTEQLAQSRVLRWAADQLRATMTTRHRRKSRGDWEETFDNGVQRAVDSLLAWSRVIHRMPPLREDEQLEPHDHG